MCCISELKIFGIFVVNCCMLQLLQCKTLNYNSNERLPGNNKRPYKIQGT